MDFVWPYRSSNDLNLAIVTFILTVFSIVTGIFVYREVTSKRKAFKRYTMHNPEGSSVPGLDPDRPRPPPENEAEDRDQ